MSFDADASGIRDRIERKFPEAYGLAPGSFGCSFHQTLIQLSD